MPKVTPFLWLESGALDAARFYVSLFPNSEVTGGEAVPLAAQLREAERLCAVDEPFAAFFDAFGRCAGGVGRLRAASHAHADGHTPHEEHTSHAQRDIRLAIRVHRCVPRVWTRSASPIRRGPQ